MNTANVLSQISSSPLVRSKSQRISTSTLLRIKAIPLVDVIELYIPLRRIGRRFVTRCPFHEERHASFSVDPAKQLFYCFGCNVGGDALLFVQRIEQCDFRQAINILATRFDIDVAPGVVDHSQLALRAELREVDERIEAILSREQILAANWLVRLRQIDRACDLESMPMWIYDEFRRADAVYTLLTLGEEARALDFLCASPQMRNEMIDEIFERGYVMDDRRYRWEISLQ